MQKITFLPPLSAVLVFMSSLIGCTTPVQIEASQNTINQLPQQTTSVKINNQTSLNLNYLSDNNNPQNQRHIFIHGTPGSAQGWSDFLVDAPENKHYIAIDRFGFGKSEPKGAITSLKAQAQAIQALLNDTDKSAILIGHSLGGPIVVQAAIDYPQDIAAIIIVAGALDPQLEKVLPIQRLGQIWPFYKILPRQIRNANSELIDLKDELIRLQEELPQLKVPTIIVHGTEDPLVPYENVAFMEKHFTNVTALEVMTLEGRGHFLPWDSANFIKEAIALAASMANE